MGDYLLAGVTAVDLSWEPGGAYAAKLLADYGADVIKVEPPAGDPVRREGPFAHSQPGPETGLLFAYLNGNKRSLTLDLARWDDRAVLDRLLARADVLIESFQPSHALEYRVTPDRTQSINPRLIHASVTPFGKTGPYAGYAIIDLEAPALSGWTYLTGAPDREPIRQGGNLPRLAPGLLAAAGILGCLQARERSGYGDFLDVSAQEVGAVMQPFPTLFSSYTGGGIVRRTGNRLPTTHPFTILPCRDGYIGAICLTDQQWENLCLMVELEHLIDDPRFKTNLLRAENADAIDAALADWLSRRTAEEIFHLAQAFRLPFALVPTARDLVNLEHFRERGFWQMIAHPVIGELIQPGRPFRVVGSPDEAGVSGPTVAAHPTSSVAGKADAPSGTNQPHHTTAAPEAAHPIPRPAPRLGEHTGEILTWLGYPPEQIAWLAGAYATPREPLTQPPGASDRPFPVPDRAVPELPLAGVRILDLTMYWAGPLATRLAADLGAEVIKVEAVQRLDGWRGTFIKADYERPWEASPAYNGINCNKLGITLNLAHPRGLALAKRLVALSHAVVENYSPRVLGQLGLDYATLRDIRPDIVLLSMSGFGGTGPWRDYVSYAATVECLAGIAALTGYRDGGPMLGGASVGDPISGLNGGVALLMALFYQQRTGRGLAIDLSQIEAAMGLLGDAILDYTVNGQVAERTGNEHPAIAPHGVYRTAGPDSWIAITAATDDQWRALCQALGRPGLTEDPRFATGLARWRHRDDLDRTLGAAVHDADHRDLMARLQAAGVPVAALLDCREVQADPQLAHRDFFQPVTRAYVGTHHQPTSGLRLGRQTLGIRSPAPTLGEHTEAVLGRLLGLDQPAIEELTAEGVIGTVPKAVGSGQ